MFSLQSISEITYSVGNLDKAKSFFCDYGGWNIASENTTSKEMLGFWGLPYDTKANEYLLQSNHHPTGQLRLIKFNNIAQDYIRSSQQPWDVGGIMDINLRVHEVTKSFEAFRDLGWHGLSDPLFQTMGPFQLYDILMKGYDDTIIAFTHRVQPLMELKAKINLPSHVYNSSLTVSDIKASEHFYVDLLGCQELTSYEVIKDKPQENMFGLPFNLADKVTCKVKILSFDGEKDTQFQIVEFEGVSGKNYISKANPPNRGFMTYRVPVKGITNYYQFLKEKGVQPHKEITELHLDPYGLVKLFAVKSPDGVWITFFEKQD